MEKSIIRWLKIGLVLEVVIMSVIALLYVFDFMQGETVQDVAIKISLGILVLTVAGAVVGALTTKAEPESPKP